MNLTNYLGATPNATQNTILGATLGVLLVFAASTVAADNNPPSVPANVTTQWTSSTTTKVNWNASSDSDGVRGYNVYRDGHYIATVHDTSYTDAGLSASNTYRYAIVAFDNSNNFSRYSSKVQTHTDSAETHSSTNESSSTINTTSTSETSTGSTPSNLRASRQIDGSVKVHWSRPGLWSNIKGYNVYRNDSYVATVKSEEYVDWSAQDSRDNDYQVVVFDYSRNFSKYSSPVIVPAVSSAVANQSVSPPPPQEQSSNSPILPTIPNGISASARDRSSISLTWNASSASSGIKGYNVYRNDSYIATTHENAYRDSGLSANSEYRYQIVSIDNSGNYSSYSDENSQSTTDDQQNQTAVKNTSVATSTTSNGPDLSGYSLAFSDEFNRNSLDTGKWNTAYLWGPNKSTNDEKQYYVDSKNNPGFGYQPFSANGEYLSIKADRTPDWLREKANWKNYVSGVITSYDSFQFTYGYAEARLRPPKGRGFFSAFWLLNAQYNGNSPEIDVAEFLGENPDVVYQTYHYYDNSWNLQSQALTETWSNDFTDDFHTFAVKWSPSEIIWYVDGKERKRFSHSEVSAQPMYLIFNVAVDGNWAVSPDSSTPFPSTMDIDYVRVYRK